MSTTVARIYESYGNALEASQELRSRGFHRDEIDLISKAANTQVGEITDIAGEISKAGVPADNVASYAATVEEGKSLLVVRAAWGAAKRAIKVVDDHGPEESVLNNEFYISELPATSNEQLSFFSLSAYLGIPHLLSDATPFSNFWNLPVLISNAAPFSSFFLDSTLTTGFSFGAPNLINNPTIFSDAFNFPVLLRRKSEK